MHTAPEGTLDAYINFINKADAVGVQTLMVQNRSFSIKAPMDVTEYNILSKKKLTEQEAAAISIKPDIREGDIQLEVEQVIQDSKRMNYTYWLRQREGFWGLLIWSYKKSA